ncbi:uncharacterized protein LOC130695942 [Daphnia carinata]|uniref:uncharacterized protein LOC130695942 n=1 Tax=Daphnia carinata TaxID=120202 RepID=UPI00257BF115|nr:uncharacterized protein LOC130695942 [Daphnia carinata]
MGCGASSQTSALETSPPDGQTAVEEDLSESGETASLAQSSLSYDLHPLIKEMKAPITFEVPGQNQDENGEAVSIIQAHPPRRLRRLEDEQINLSQEELERRHALAEQRRQEALRMRAQSARLSTAKGPRRQLLAPIANE